MLNAGCDSKIAANRAITEPFLQVLETDLVETHPSQKGFVFVHSTTVEAAQLLASVDTIVLGILGSWQLRLRPARKQDEDSLKHAAVSSKLPRNNQAFDNAQMLRHFKEVSTAGISNAKILASAGKLQTAAADINMYVFDKDGKVLSAEELSSANITSVCYTPGNDAIADLSSPSKRARADSKSGTSMVWKFAEPLSATLFVLGSTAPTKSKYGGKIIYYTPHGGSWGTNFLQKTEQTSKKDAYVAARAFAANKPVEQSEIQVWKAASEAGLMRDTYRLLGELPPQSRPEDLDMVPDQPEDFAANVALSILNEANDGFPSRKRDREVSNADFWNTCLPCYTCAMHLAWLKISLHMRMNVNQLMNDLHTMHNAITNQQYETQSKTLSQHMNSHCTPAYHASLRQQPTHGCLCRLSESLTWMQQRHYASTLIRSLMDRMDRQTTWRWFRSRADETPPFRDSKVHRSETQTLVRADHMHAFHLAMSTHGTLNASYTNAKPWFDTLGNDLTATHRHVRWHLSEPAPVTYTNRAAKLSSASQIPLDFTWADGDSTESPTLDIYVNFVHSRHQTCQHSQVSRQAVQAYRLYLTNRGYMQRSQDARTLGGKTSHIFLETFSNVSYALMGGLGQLIVTLAVQTLCSVLGVLTYAPIAAGRLTHATQCKSLPKNLLCYCLICIQKVDCAFSKTHCMTHLVLICCELATMHDYIKRIVEDTGPYTSLPALTCMVGLQIFRAIWLSQMLNEEQNARHNSRPKARSQIDHPKCANGKYWSRIRYGQRKFAKQRQLRNQSIAQWVTKWLWKLLHKVAIPAHAFAGLVRKWRTGGRSRDECAARGAAAQGMDPKGGCNSGTGQHLRMQPASRTKGLHMERQLRKFCQIHALNALLGRTAIQPADILSFCKERAKEDTGLGRALRGSDTWSPTEGNFCDMVINAFLHYHSAPTVRLCSVADNIPIGSEENRFLSGLPAGHDAFVLKWNCGNQPHEDTAYGHAVCVRKHPVTKEWYLLNSEIGHPVKLTSIDWPLLKGSVYILAEGSAYGQNQLWNAVDEGYTQVFDDLKYMTPDKLVITQEATSHARIAQHPRQQQQCIRLDLEPEHVAGQTSEPKLPNNASSGHAKLLVARDCTEELSTRKILSCRLHTSKAMLHKMPAIMPSCLVVHLAGTEGLPVAKDCIEGLRTKTALLHCLSASKPMLHKMLMNLHQKELSPAVQRAKCCRRTHTCKRLSRQRV